MTTFAFLPRAVSKYTKEWQGISRPPPSPSPPPDPTTDSEPDHDSKGEEQINPKQHQDIASLISLALSDYNIWLDPDLCCKLDACLHDETSPDDAACTSSYFLPYRHCMPPPQLYRSTTSSAAPRSVVHSHRPPASNHSKPRWSKPSERTRAIPSRCASVSPPPPPPHSPRPFGPAPEKPPGRKTWVGTKCVGETGRRCEIVRHVGGPAPDGTT